MINHSSDNATKSDMWTASVCLYYGLSDVPFATICNLDNWYLEGCRGTRKSIRRTDGESKFVQVPAINLYQIFYLKYLTVNNFEPACLENPPTQFAITCAVYNRGCDRAVISDYTTLFAEPCRFQVNTLVLSVRKMHFLTCNINFCDQVPTTIAKCTVGLNL